MKTDIVKQPDGTFMLFRNDNPVICPFMTATPTQDVRGLQPRIIMSFNPCSSHCAKFNATTVDDQIKVTLTCGSETVIIGTVKEESKILQQ
jgi:hypothetical protein